MTEIQTHIRGTFHVTEDPRTARFAIKHGLPMHTRVAGRELYLEPDQVASVGPTPRAPRWTDRVMAWAQLLFAVVLMMPVSTILMIVGMVTLVANFTGEQADASAWAFPLGVALFLGSGILGEHARERIGLEG